MSETKDRLKEQNQRLNEFAEKLSELSSVEIYISPRKIIRFLCFVVFGLLLASVIGQFSKYFIDPELLKGLVTLFYLEAESNIPTVYSSFVLLLCSLLIAVIAIAKKKQRDRFAFHWKCLSLIFLYLSIDEAASIHEITITPLRSALNAGGVLFFTWVVPAAILLLIFSLVYFKFLFSLPTKTRNFFILAAIVYISGGLGVELIGGWYAESYGMENLIYATIAMIEELFEMLGTTTFVYALLQYMESEIKFVPVYIKNK